jgi:hypothetical protein
MQPATTLPVLQCDSSEALVVQECGIAQVLHMMFVRNTMMPALLEGIPGRPSPCGGGWPWTELVRKALHQTPVLHIKLLRHRLASSSMP